MTQEEKAKAYDEALAAIKGKYEMAKKEKAWGTVKWMEEVFPVLAESEDERIRKEIVTFLKEGTPYHCPNSIIRQKWATWLEKQKEQKPNVELIKKSWYMEGYHDGRYNNEPKWLIQTGKEGPRYEENPKYGTQMPAEWSEEDEERVREILSYFTIGILPSIDRRVECVNWLKSLFQQPKHECEASKNHIG